ncbi:MAG: YhcH/YjgK/YiaL family protein [Lachnospiraceae bacterium]
MIVDKLENIMFYNNMVNHLETAMEAIKNWRELDIGKYPFEGGFFMIQKGQTKFIEEGTFEAHRKYLDIQIVVEGSEEVAWADIGDLSVEIPYNEEKDAERLNGPKDHTMLITEGMFYIAFPHDAHKPISHTKKEQHYTKIVIKLPV